MLKYELFRYSIVVAAYPVFVYVVSRTLATCLPARETTYTNAGYAATTILIRKVHILTSDFS